MSFRESTRTWPLERGGATGLIGLLAFLSLATAAAYAGDWPQFRGPTGQGHAPDASVPLSWSETENVAWKVPVPGRGWSSPVIAGGLVWLTTAVTDRGAGTSLRLLAYDTTNGEPARDVEVFAISDTTLLNQKNSFASPTPVIDPDGERVHVHFGAQGTAAVATGGDSAGEVLWRTRFPYTSQHGNGGSPILRDGLLDREHRRLRHGVPGRRGRPDGRGTLALGPTTLPSRRPTRPRSPSRSGTLRRSSTSAPSAPPPTSRLTGREIWRVEYPGGFSNVSRPVYGHGLVYLSTGFNEPVLLAVRPTGEGDVTNSEVAWRLRRGAPLTVSPILVGNELYTVTDSGIATCIDALTGDIHWQHRLGGNHSASPVFGGGRIYFQNEEGVTTVIEPGLEFEQLARNELDGSTLASIAVSKGAFLVRTGTHLYRIEESR